MKLALLAFTFFLSACTASKTSKKESDFIAENQKAYTLKPNEYIYWINSYKVNCTGVAPMMCMRVQKSETINPEKWHYFYSEIKGFDYEAGYIYKLIVKEEKIPESEIMQDASSISFTLVRLLEKKKDNHSILYDIWALTHIKGVKVNLKDFTKQPQLEINLTQNRIIGNDGCNSLSGKIKTVTDNQLEFDKVISTRMACANMKVSNEVNSLLNQVRFYELNNLQLILFNSKKEKILQYKKVD